MNRVYNEYRQCKPIICYKDKNQYQYAKDVKHLYTYNFKYLCITYILVKVYGII